MHATLTAEPIDVGALIARTEDPSSGALAVFVGTVRDLNQGKRVIAITYEAYEELAGKELAAIEDESLARFDVRRCVIVHRTGYVALGEASVAIVVRSAHREAAFAALRYAIEELKKRATIWKLEHYEDGDAKYLDGVSLVDLPTEKTP